MTSAEDRIAELQQTCADLRRQLEDVAQRTRQQETLRKSREDDLQRRLQSLKDTLQRVRVDERHRRRHSEARAERFKVQVESYRNELSLREQGVRYQIGDAFVRAAKPSLDTLKLPLRLATLLTWGLKRRAARRREIKQCQQDVLELHRPTTAGGAAGEQPSTGAPGTTAELEADVNPALLKPFATTPPGLRRRDDLCIAAVTDEFSWRAWQFEADVYTFTPKTWRAALEARKPDLLLIESAWSGLGDSWYFQLRDLGQRGEVIKYYAVPDVIRWCRQHDVPTVFYNKEDPPNFDVFIEAAKLFDYVFTSDANCIPDYCKHVGHERVFALPFAAQPRIHNPILTDERNGAVCFAGTWYAHRHLARQEDAKSILQPALDFGLHIFDRMANSDNPAYRWPDAFLPAVQGALPYARMLTAYKRYKVFLNINSVTNSPTMFSRRVFELLACGTPVISSYSDGIEELLGADLVPMSDDEEQTHKLLERLLGDDEYRARLSLRGQRKVFCEHTYTARLQTILDEIGLQRPIVGRPTLTMIAAVENAAQVAAAWESFRRQSYQQKQLVLCAVDPAALADVERLTAGAPPIRVLTGAGATWGRLLSEAASGCPDGYLAALNPEHCYGEHYLTDYANATLYVTDSALGKTTVYTADGNGEPRITEPGHEYRITDHVDPWSLCMPCAPADQWTDALSEARTPKQWWQDAQRRCGRIYSADRFNYVARIADQPISLSESSDAHALECVLA